MELEPEEEDVSQKLPQPEESVPKKMEVEAEEEDVPQPEESITKKMEVEAEEDDVPQPEEADSKPAEIPEADAEEPVAEDIPKPKTKPSLWVCPKCYEENGGRREKCMSCGQPRAQEYIPQPSKKRKLNTGEALGKIYEERAEAAALFEELQKLEQQSEQDVSAKGDFYDEGDWDRAGIEDEIRIVKLEIAKKKTAAEAEAAGVTTDGGEQKDPVDLTDPAEPTANHIVVCGSINADRYVEVDRLPGKGETLSGSGGFTSVGGKSANCAAAIGKLGGNVSFVGYSGDGQDVWFRQVMGTHSVGMGQLVDLPDITVGQAYIFLFPGGENSIVLVGGANTSWPEKLTAGQVRTIKKASAVCLCQEVTEESNILCGSIAKAAGIPVILDAGGADRPIKPELMECLAILAPNETELARLSGMECGTDDEIIAAARKIQKELNAPSILAHIGDRGSIWIPVDGEIIRQEATKVEKIVDTTGAGDGFTGAFVKARYGDGLPVEEALEFASRAGAIACQTKGTIPSFATRVQMSG